MHSWSYKRANRSTIGLFDFGVMAPESIVGYFYRALIAETACNQTSKGLHLVAPNAILMAYGTAKILAGKNRNGMETAFGTLAFGSAAGRENFFVPKFTGH